MSDRLDTESIFSYYFSNEQFVKSNFSNSYHTIFPFQLKNIAAFLSIQIRIKCLMNPRFIFNVMLYGMDINLLGVTCVTCYVSYRPCCIIKLGYVEMIDTQDNFF